MAAHMTLLQFFEDSFSQEKYELRDKHSIKFPFTLSYFSQLIPAVYVSSPRNLGSFFKYARVFLNAT
jgi:hypothetical protein